MGVVHVVENDRARKKTNLVGTAEKKKHKFFLNTIYLYPTKFLQLYHKLLFCTFTLSVGCRFKKISIVF